VTAAYELADLRHCYGDRCVVDVPSLEVRPGEVLAVVGPSGAGKSTLLRLLNFLETPSSGRIVYHGTEVGPTAPLELRRQVVTVFQRPMLLRRSVAANIRLGRRIRGETSGREEVDALIARLGLTGLGHAHARTLSAGEGQRVALARALIVEPRVLLLDEPTSNLDPYNVGLIEGIVRSENVERGTTVVLVTHDIFQARRMAHRVALLIGGRLIELADTETIFSTPGRDETAAFLRGDLVDLDPPAAPSVRTRHRWRR
jgi:tungstate transport system ATP-binding protein